MLAHQDGIHLPTGDDREMEGMRRVMRAMRSPDKVLPCGMSVKDALEEVKNSVVHTWPVTDKPGIVGLVTRAMLEKAAGDGGGAGTLEGFLTDPDFPHLHSDQPLSVALDVVAPGATKTDSLTVTTADGGPASVNASASTTTGGNWRPTEG